ncbi:MAG: hypothetical protein HC903_32200 [Methylacidiphilales bacterium]|nr:hypothetical protein [Candidatus Methylacidiphilales bacterium]NJR17292.1 hypothetical protein [Calothrix sp. CSU_2_0]
MNRLLTSLIALGLVLGSSAIANADAAYEKFKKTQMAEFSGDKAPENCRERKLEVKENGNKIVYELCAFKGKPIYLRSRNDEVVYGFYSFKSGKLIQVDAPDAFISVGYRNGQPVVKWDWGNETVDYKLSADFKASSRQDAVKINRILKKFGIRTP